MKIKLSEGAQIGATFFPRGTELTVDKETGMQLLKDGKAEGSDHTELREVIAEAVSYEKAAEVLEDLPERANDLIKKIGEITNIPALTELTADTRITVQRAVIARLKELGQ